MISINKFRATDEQFRELSRIENLINHDFIVHPDDTKNDWKNRNKSLANDKLLLYNNDTLIGNLNYSQGRDGNSMTAEYSLYLDPIYNNKGYRSLLYKKMLEEVRRFRCNKIITTIYEHVNYKEHKKILVKNGFKLAQTNREYSCDIRKINFKKYYPLIQRLESKGIKLYDSKKEMKDWENHYIKLEELSWIYGKDVPMPKGIEREREPFKEFMKDQIDYEKNYYGVEIIAVKDNKYIGSTDLDVFYKSEPHKAWTGSLGVLKEFRRIGVATAIKIKALEILFKNGITKVMTDNEINNPMYKINEKLGFRTEPFSLDYIKDM